MTILTILEKLVMEPIEENESCTLKRQISELETKISVIESGMIEQEHRLLRVFGNLWAYRKGRLGTENPNREASMKALFHWILGLIVPGGSGGNIWNLVLGLVGIFFAWKTWQLSDSQLVMEESGRRALISEELTSALDQVNAAATTREHGKMLPKDVIGRLVAVSQVAQPYRYISDAEGNKNLGKKYLSPERGRLFLAIALMRQEESNYLLNQCNLNNCDLANATLRGFPQMNSLDLENSNFYKATFDTTALIQCKFMKSDFRGAKFIKSRLRGGIFDDANFEGATFAATDFSSADFSRCNLVGAKEVFSLGSEELDSCKFDGAVFHESQIDNETYRKIFQPRGYPRKDFKFVSIN